MSQNLSFRKFYRPLQPSVFFDEPKKLIPGREAARSAVLYSELNPAPSLLHLIHCYWELKSESPLVDPYIYNVAADGCIDIFFESSRADESFAMGFSTGYTSFTLGHSFRYAGVRFLPAAFPMLFRTDASDLTDTYEDLDSISADVSRFISTRMNSFMTLYQIKEEFDNLFSELADQNQPETDYRVLHAIEKILKNRGAITVEKELDTGLSARQLRRHFNRYIGGNIKTFSRVVRFQHILGRVTTESKPDIPSILYDAGYFDQSHFIRDFKTFFGQTPSKLLSTGHLSN